MSGKTLYLFPPNYHDINRAFDVRGKPIIFAYGDTIYNPSRIKLPPQLIAHEAVHQARQGNNPRGWWERYIAEPAFRLDEEIPAHIAEYKVMADRADCEIYLFRIAGRLASPLYGSLISAERARAVILHGAKDTPSLSPTETHSN